MHRDKRIKTVPSLTEYLVTIWLDPSTTSNSLEGLFKSASRHNVYALEHLGFNLQYKCRNILLYLVQCRNIPLYLVQCRNIPLYLVHWSNGRWILLICRILLRTYTQV
ncbi:hypothetical protein PROFUN_15128 [Planoprotostelium fungivorum]|uniref:Uncharacterized protein n=1 Tax=Planoprotostelium fungivorum TaxID=1890364 RepID=A0A2P6MZX4_9EUKA|nr:hypothetical protein PROFUN_15128 [Planoprotostelium fungivorum]